MGSWSVILNILLLAGVVIAIARTMMLRNANSRSNYMRASIAQAEQTACDDIIAVRKVNRKLSDEAPTFSPKSDAEVSQPSLKTVTRPAIKPEISMESRPKTQPQLKQESFASQESAPSIMVFLLAKEGRQFAGYELLQTLLASGLRFGEGGLFHRHQHSNGQGPVLCSVAAATESGVFDLQNIGAFSVRGLCIFMQTSGSAAIDEERFTIMLDMARQLGDDLDAHLLDDKRQPLTDVAVRRYQEILNCSAVNDLELV